jgi:hypothetical protein
MSVFTSYRTLICCHFLRNVTQTGGDVTVATILNPVSGKDDSSRPGLPMHTEDSFRICVIVRFVASYILNVF